MRNVIRVGVAACLLAMASAAIAATPERYLHVRVEDASKGESVNINLPLSMAEKILPTVNHGRMHQGRVAITHSDIEGVDLRTILDAVRAAADGEFVTIKQKDQEVRVAKSNGSLVVHIRDSQTDAQKVDITVPMKVVDALFSTAKEDELDIVAAIHALGDAGETLLVTVEDATEHIRVWVDSRVDQDK